MDVENEFLQYLRLQDEPHLLTKSELLAYVRARGASVSDRQLTSLITEGVIPRSVRFGSRAGAFPEMIGPLLLWVIRSRQRGLSIDAIKQLTPVWRLLHQQLKSHVLDLAAIEERARDEVTLPEALFAVPTLFESCLVCPGCTRPLEGIKVIRKDGETQQHDAEHPTSVGFLVVVPDEGDSENPWMASMGVVLPVVYEGDEPNTIVLGLPNGVKPPVRTPACEVEGDPPDMADRGVPAAEEVSA